MPFIVDTFLLSKKGNTESEIEDSCYPFYSFCTTTSKLSYAISDGASSSYCSKKWAQLLTKTFYSSENTDNLNNFIKKCQILFDKQRIEFLQKSPLSVWDYEKIKLGQDATLLGVSIDQNKVIASAVGDSCIFLFDAERNLKLSFPIFREDDFTNHPSLVNSNIGDTSHNIQELGFSFNTGDIMFLATDALSELIIKCSASRQLIRELISVCDSNDSNKFQKVINFLRNQKTLKNDDVCLSIIRYANE